MFLGRFLPNFFIAKCFKSCFFLIIIIIIIIIVIMALSQQIHKLRYVSILMVNTVTFSLQINHAYVKNIWTHEEALWDTKPKFKDFEIRSSI